MAPTLTAKLEYIFQTEKSGDFEHTGKVRGFYLKYWKSKEILASFYFYSFSILMEVY